MWNKSTSRVTCVPCLGMHIWMLYIGPSALPLSFLSIALGSPPHIIGWLNPPEKWLIHKFIPKGITNNMTIKRIEQFHYNLRIHKVKTILNFKGLCFAVFRINSRSNVCGIIKITIKSNSKFFIGGKLSCCWIIKKP